MAEMFYLQWLLAQEQAAREQYRQMMEFINYPASSSTPPPVPTCTAEYVPPYTSCEPLDSEETPELYYAPAFDPDQISRHSLSPPLIPEDRPPASQKRRKQQASPPKLPPLATIHS